MVRRFARTPLAVLLCGLGASAAQAATHTVLNTNNSGAGSLRGAIAAAASGDTIAFAAGLAGTITLGSSLPIIDKTLTITGPGADTLTISGGGTQRIFGVKSNAETDTLFLSGLTLAHGGQGSLSDGCGLYSGYGGAICSMNANVVVTDSIFAQNAADVGGAILLYDMDGGAPRKVNTLTLQRCVFANNQASYIGSAVFAYSGSSDDPALITVDRSEFSGNSGGSSGSALTSIGAITSVSNSSFLDNSVTGSGAAIHVSSGDLTVSNSTFSGNQASHGGAIYSYANHLTIESSTLVGNVATTPGDGDAMYAEGYSARPATVSIRNSVLAGNSGADVKLATEATATVDYSLIQNPTGIPAGSITHSLTGISPQIGALVTLGVPISNAYAHPMRGFVPQTGSPAINAGNPNSAGLPSYDMRGAGYPRVQGGRIDIGAIESNYPQTVPGAPTLVQVVPGKHSMELHFAPPVSDGGAVIDRYMALCTSSIVPSEAIGTSSPLTVTGLTTGNRYTCSVSAHNAVGYGPSSVQKTLVAKPPDIVPVLSTLLK